MSEPHILTKAKGFVIYDRISEKFCNGSSYVYWGDHPKLWTKLGSVRGHLTNVAKYVCDFKTSNRQVSEDWMYRGYAKTDAIVIDISTNQVVFEVNDFLNSKIEELELEAERRAARG